MVRPVATRPSRRLFRPPAAPVFLPAALAACGRDHVQSALAPIGTDAARIADLAWVLFVGGGLIFLATAVIALVATFGTEGQRRVVGSRRFVLAGGVVFPVAALTALLAYTLGVTRAVEAAASPEPPLRIEMTGRQFWWEARYPGVSPGDGVVTANEIHIPVGRDVELAVASADVIHSVWIPALHGKIDMIPGRVNTIRLRADRPGVVRGQCTEFCGAQHALMAFWVVAETPEGFERWLARQSRPAEPPGDEALAHGMRLFGQVGCGACHAVRGTGWNGQTGPDLTHVGSRLSLAAGTLSNHYGAFAGWIAGSQDIKPGNLMPSYNTVLDGRELRAVSAWLESLK